MSARRLTELSFQRERCPGCRHDYYNHKQPGDGWNAATSGEGCWHLPDIRYDRKAKHYECDADTRRRYERVG